MPVTREASETLLSCEKKDEKDFRIFLQIFLQRSKVRHHLRVNVSRQTIDALPAKFDSRDEARITVITAYGEVSTETASLSNTIYPSPFPRTARSSCVQDKVIAC